MLSMRPIADEEGHYYDVSGLRQAVTIANTGLFLDKNGLDIRINPEGPQSLGVEFNRFARVRVLCGSVARDKERYFPRSGCPWKGELLNYLPGASEEYFRHFLVRSDGFAIEKPLPPSNLIFPPLRPLRKPQVLWDNIITEISLADKHWHYKNPSLLQTCQNGLYVRFLFPKRLSHLGK